MKNIFIALILCVGLPANLAAMEEQRTLYCLTSGNEEVFVSNKLIEASPYLKRLAKSTQVEIDLKEELFPTIAFVDSLLKCTCQTQMFLFKQIADSAYLDLVSVLFKFDMRLLLDRALQAYKEKLMGFDAVKKHAGVATLINLAASYVGEHFDEYDQDSLEQLPTGLWHAVLCKVPLHFKNFECVNTAMERLNGRYQEECRKQDSAIKVLKSPLKLTPEQYDSLSSIAHKIEELSSSKKILALLNGLSTTVPGQGHEAQLKIVRHILRCDDSPLTNEQRFKIGWRIALSDSLLGATLIDELAYFLQSHPLMRKGVPIFFKGNLCPCVTPPGVRHTCNFFWIRSLLASLAQELNLFDINKTFDTLPSMHFVKFSSEAVSDSFLCSFIDQLQQDLKLLPEYLLSNKIHLLQAFVNHNFTTAGSLKEYLCKKPEQLLTSNNPWSVQIQGYKFNSLLIYRLGCYDLAKFSKRPFKAKNVDKDLKSSLNKEFINVTSQWLHAMSILCNDLIKFRPADDVLGNDMRFAEKIVHKVITEHLLLDLLLRGADFNVQDGEGNTIAHKALANGDAPLFDFLYLVAKLGLDTIDMHCKNNRGETPLVIMQSLELVNYVYLQKLCTIAKSTNTKLSDKQILQVKGLLDRVKALDWDLRHPFVQIGLEKGNSNVLTCYEEILWRINESKMTAYEKIRFLWKCVLKEKDERLRTKLFESIAKIPKEKEDQVELPELFDTQDDVSSLYTLVKDLQEGRQTIKEYSVPLGRSRYSNYWNFLIASGSVFIAKKQKKRKNQVVIKNF